jgi:hypothetical protein
VDDVKERRLDPTGYFIELGIVAIRPCGIRFDDVLSNQHDDPRDGGLGEVLAILRLGEGDEFHVEALRTQERTRRRLVDTDSKSNQFDGVTEAAAQVPKRIRRCAAAHQVRVAKHPPDDQTVITGQIERSRPVSRGRSRGNEQRRKGAEQQEAREDEFGEASSNHCCT